jgi:hypothetical protein
MASQSNFLHNEIAASNVQLDLSLITLIKNLSFATTSRSVLELIKCPTHVLPEVKRPERGAYHFHLELRSAMCGVLPLGSLFF